MVTTVTTTTVTTITTIATMGLATVISMATAVVLISFLATKELAAAKASSFSSRLGRFLSISVVPLLMAFSVIMAMEIIQVIS